MTLLIIAVTIPLGLDYYLPVPEDNPLTHERIELGRRLFIDRRLSRDGSISCASCHQAERAFSDGRPTAAGVFGRIGRRNTPALINRAYGRSFFWDGRISTLEEQVLKPIENPDEMDMPIAEASGRVGIGVVEISRALASYVRSLLSGGARFDRYVNGERTALSEVELRGLELFRGKANCSACHAGPNFTDEEFHNTGTAWRGGRVNDAGRFGHTGNSQDLGKFRTPTLRDVEVTAPYMHDGSLSTLEEVIEHYDGGGNRNAGLDTEIRPLGLSAVEKTSLAAFLRALTRGQ